MAMNDDLKINFEKVGKACKQVREEWEKIMRENNPFDTISKIAKDIADRQDKEKALEFTKCIGKLLRENGVTPVIKEYRTGGTLKYKNLIEEYYGVEIIGIDFTEHDKKFKDEITQLKHDLEKTYNQLMEVEKDAHEHIAELEKTRGEWADKAVEWKEKFEKAEKEIKELESELEVKDNLLKIKNGLCGNNGELPTDPMEVTQMLINSTYEYESSTLEKALYKCGDTRTTERYSIDDLEQIAEHLLVYCKHPREDEE